ncbi:PLD nuclease N-terminal domain-containing protein [Pedobacter sp. SYSU D00535]|uniref:PLD nuclease N-terminal domain-containing protein n=1 Tax=Pedobacter sp. SYSU D00535 TaxID=2810308 RepID=UPI001A96A956|nr:PLD nuclease N-terminal domain-containing protein [Pedobacter sp. SYSU D00535]
MKSLLFLNLGTPELVLILFLGVLPLTLMVIAFVDIVRSSFKDSATKVVWALIVLLMPVLGALLYFVIGRTGKIQRA